MKYYAIEGTKLSMRGEWISGLLVGKNKDSLPGISGKKGLLFSNVTLEQFIREEYLHDKFDLTKNLHRSLRTLSSGEQKKALLAHLLSQNPEFIILDNPFDCLDADSNITLKNQILELARDIPVLQIFKRRQDILPIITHVLHIENEKLSLTIELRDYLADTRDSEDKLYSGSIPAPLENFEDIPEKIVEFRNASVSYQSRPILTDINWTVKRGEFWKLSGPNGSGKTTLLSMIYGDNPKAYGLDLKIFGKRKGAGESIWEIKQKIGYFTPFLTELFQRRQTVEQMVISGLTDSIGLYRKALLKQRELAAKWIALLELTELREERYARLSQVEQRMVLIARAMIKHPPLLILDEPSTGLDDESAGRLVALINRIASESQTAIIYVSHRHEKGLRPGLELRLIETERGSMCAIVKL